MRRVVVHRWLHHRELAAVHHWAHHFLLHQYLVHGLQLNASSFVPLQLGSELSDSFVLLVLLLLVLGEVLGRFLPLARTTQEALVIEYLVGFVLRHVPCHILPATGIGSRLQVLL